VIKQDDGINVLDRKLTYEDIFYEEFPRKRVIYYGNDALFLMVDNVGCRAFVNSLNSKLKMIFENTMKNDMMKVFSREKIALKELSDHKLSRIAVNTNMWIGLN